jgi:putative ABC transport system permease protein
MAVPERLLMKRRRLPSPKWDRTDPGRRGSAGLGLNLDIRFALRSLRRSPAFTAVAVATLALGIGSSTAMFSVLNAAMGRSLPLLEPDRLVMGRGTYRGEVWPWASFPDYMDYRDRAGSLQSLAAFGGGSWLITVSGTGEPEQARICEVTPNLFETLGVAPFLGGTFTIDEQPSGGGGQVVISHGFWQRWFGGDPQVVGRSLTVRGEPLTVLGVMPDGFRFYYDTDLWKPPWPGNSRPETRFYTNWLTVGRLARGATLETAQAEMDVIARQLQAAYPDTNEGRGLRLEELHSVMVEGARQNLLVLTGAIVLLLLIACGNVASLLIARGATRTSELAVRSALGAGRSRLTRQLLVESSLLALAGGGLGVILALWLQGAILGFVPLDALGIRQVGVSGSMLGIGLVLSLGTVLLVGLFPSLAAARANPARELKDGVRRTASGSGIRWRGGMVVVQVALSLVLLVGSGLLIRSLARLQGVETGFRTDGLLTATVTLPSVDYPVGERRLQFFQRLKERAEALPGVENVALVNRLPVLHPWANYRFWNPEHPPEGEIPTADRRLVLPGYFRTMEIPLVEGRVLEESDVEGSPPVVVLTRRAAEMLYPGESAVGRRVALDMGREVSATFEIVGVVEDHLLTSLSRAPRPAVFFSYAQLQEPTMRLAVAATVAPTNLVRPIQEEIWELDGDIVLSDARTMEDALSDTIAGSRSITTVLTLFSVVALALAALGLYGVLAFFVNQRIHEIGIRVALGASGGRVLGMIVSRGMLLVALGSVLGIGAAAVVTRLVQGMLFQVSATDPVTFAGVTGVFLLVALGACVLPAWRGLRVDPMEAFRRT